MSSSPEPLTGLAESLLNSAAVTSASPATTLISTPAPITTTISVQDGDDGHPTHYPPMTTQWTVPPSCTWTFDVDQEPQLGTPGPIAWLDLEPIADASTLSCYPTGMFYDGQTGTFSPATCPNGWTTVSVRQDDKTPMTLATTTAVCCSSEFTLDGGYCKRQQPTVVAVPIVYNHTDGTYDVLTDMTSTLTSATLAVHTIKALFRESDKELLGLTDEEDIRDEDVSGGRLSLATRIGIAIGAIAGGIVAIGLGLWLLFRKHRSSNEKSIEHGAAGIDTLDDDPALARRSRGDVPEPPPPAYAFAERTSVTDDGNESDMTARDGEIQVLRAQKAAIQRRIDELESVVTNDDARHQ